MLPLPGAGSIGALDLPQLPPVPSGPNPTGPGFTAFYDRLLSQEEPARALPGRMEVAPILAPSASLATPFVASPEFPGAVDPDGLRLPVQAAGEAPQGGLEAFVRPFKEHMAEVNRLQHHAAGLANEAALGGDVDLHDVMIASEKAGVAMQLTVQIRNKVVEAYQEVMRMQV